MMLTTSCALAVATAQAAWLSIANIQLLKGQVIHQELPAGILAPGLHSCQQGRDLEEQIDDLVKMSSQ